MATTHGHRAGKRSPTYISWQSMIARCTREAHPRYPDYGGRGIQVDPRWIGKGGFEKFLADLGPRPKEKTLDRKDPDGHYTPDNCQWATIIEQRWNRRDMRERSEEIPEEYHVTPLWDEPEPQKVDDDIPF